MNPPSPDASRVRFRPRRLKKLVSDASTQLIARAKQTVRLAAPGGSEGAPWHGVPERYRDALSVPEFDAPKTLDEWEATRSAVRATVEGCLGNLPERPSPDGVRVLSREHRGAYQLEKFEFDNGVDSVVPGYLMLPTGQTVSRPAVITIGGSTRKESTTIDRFHPQAIGEALVRQGYVVAAIDQYFHGERLGQGPAGPGQSPRAEQESLFKFHLWCGRTLWGMMLRDQRILLDYLCTRPEVDATRIATTGMSMGCTASWWLAALDDRIRATVGVACFTRYTDLIAHGGLAQHGVYYFVPGILQHFDTEAIFALIAPRPLLMLSGDRDCGAPTSGIRTLESKLGRFYDLYKEGPAFRSVVYPRTAHVFTDEMKRELLAWFERWL